MTKPQKRPWRIGQALRWLAGAAFAASAAGAAFIAMPEAGAAGADSRSGLPVLGKLPPLDGAVTWLNSPPLGARQLQGKVVLVDFWTYSCINCIRTLPYLRAWAQKYRDQGLVVVGVHTPEFAFEQDIANVNKAVARFGIDYPVAVDSDRRIWNAFRNNAWPVFYIADARGQLRARVVGEGNYDKTERIIQSLLADAGSRGAAGGLTAPRAAGEQAAPDMANLAFRRNLCRLCAGIEFRSGKQLVARCRPRLRDKEAGLNEWSLAGNWTVGAERARLNRAGAASSTASCARPASRAGAGIDNKPVRIRCASTARRPDRIAVRTSTPTATASSPRHGSTSLSGRAAQSGSACSKSASSTPARAHLHSPSADRETSLEILDICTTWWLMWISDRGAMP
jgi:thiol-disulfide isomerase/thioredoxin